MFTLRFRKASRCASLRVPSWVVVCIACVTVSAPRNAAWSDDLPAKDSKGLLAVVLDESRPYTNRATALQEANGLPMDAKVQLLQSVIREADDRFAMAGAFSAIRQGIHTPEIVHAIRDRISRWTLPSSPGIVQGIVHELSGDDGSIEAVLPIVRDVLALIGKRQAPSDRIMHESEVINVNWSSLALVPQGKPMDGPLLRDAVLVYPDAYIGWLGLYKLDAVDDGMQALARRVYTDEHVDILPRVAAAIAIQGDDKQAVLFALAASRAYLEEFGTRNTREIFADVTNIYEANAQMKTAFFRMNNDMVLVALLRFLKGNEAKEMVLGYLNSPNEVVGDFVRLVAARQWPEEVKSRLAAIPQDKRWRTLATINYLHPDQVLPDPPTGLTPEEWESVKGEIKRNLSRPQNAAIRLVLDW